MLRPDSSISAFHHIRSLSARPILIGDRTGQATRVWADHFGGVTGVDPSSKMLDAAKEKLPQEKTKSVNYVHSTAEELSFLPNNSVDMVAAGGYHILHIVDETSQNRTIPQYNRAIGLNTPEYGRRFQGC